MTGPAPPTSAERLHLSPNVCVCVAEGQAIFLDLGRDEYCAIPLPTGFLANGGQEDEANIEAALQPFAVELTKAGLLSFDRTATQNFCAYQALPRPIRNIFDPDDQRAFGLVGEAGNRVKIGWRDRSDFVAASRLAAQRLKTGHVSDIVCDVRSRKVTLPNAELDLEAYRRHVAIFRKLRPWYPRSYLCMYDALSLIEFLARRRLYPDWVFGVQSQPFGAHCWLQADAHVLNENVEYANQFTPIMLV